MNKEGYCLYAVLCEGRTGQGQPVFVGLMSSEKAENLEIFFQTLKSVHTRWQQVEVAFTDKDFNEIAAVKKAMPQIVMLHATYSVVYV